MGLEKKIESRLRWLDKQFRTGGKFTIEDLLDGLRSSSIADVAIGISKRTLYNDFDRLRDRVNLISNNQGHKKCYYYDDPRVSYFDAGASENILAIERLITQISQFEGLANFTTLQNSINELAKKYGIDIENPIVSFETNHDVRGLGRLDELYTAIKSQKVIDIKYESFNRSTDEILSLEVHPYHLKEYANRWYLIGYTKEYGELTCLPLDRIKGIVGKDDLEFHTPSEEIDYSSLFDDRIGVSPGKTINLVIRVNPTRLRYLRSKPLHNSQTDESCDPDGWHRLSYKLMDNEELTQKLLSLGPEIEVIAPQRIRSRIKKRITEASALYDKH